VEKISKKRLVRPEAMQMLGRISGLLLAVYVLLKTIDTLVWINRTSPGNGFPAAQYYAWHPFGTWILFTEIALLGMVPALILLTPKLRARTSWQEVGTFLAVLAYGVLVYSFSFRYFQLFPDERELKLEVAQVEEEPALVGRY
jgi:molybdopterin-containing oxidoreductase family membrane subunit